MPKMKTRRAVAKRFSLTGTGKVRAHKGGKSHLLAHKARKRKRHLKDLHIITGNMARRVRASLPDAD